MKHKKLTAMIFLSTVMLLVGCSGKGSDKNDKSNEDKRGELYEQQDSKDIHNETAASECLEYIIEDNEVTITDCDESASGNLEIPSTIEGYPVKTIDYSAFSRCASLTSINIPNSVKTIREYAFSNCTSLTSINIPNSVTVIEGYVFVNCTSLDSITIPNSVTKISAWMFKGCDSLTSITIPDSIEYINDSAFSGCDSLTSITIPNSIISITAQMFYGWDSLTDIYYKGSEEEWNKKLLCTISTNITIHFNS